MLNFPQFKMRKIEWDDPDCYEANYRALSIVDLLGGRAIIVEDARLALAQAPRWHRIVVRINSILRAHYIDSLFVTRVWKEPYNNQLTSVHVLLPSVYHWPVKDQSSSGSVVTLFDSHGAGSNFDLGIYDEDYPDRTYLKQNSWNGKVQIFWCLGHCARMDTFYLTKVYGDKVPVKQKALTGVASQVPVGVLIPQP